MATYTTILSLRKPERTGADDTVDVQTDVNDNMDIIDLNINLRIATSAGRPATPFTGQLVYETDTTNIMLWNGSSWQNYGSNNSAQGKKGKTESVAVGTTLTSASAETLYISVTFAAKSDRNYWIETTGHIECTATTAAPGQAQVRTRWAAGGSVANTDTLFGSASTNVECVRGTGSANGQRFYNLYELPAATHATTGNITVGLFLRVPNANDSMRFSGSATTPCSILVRDVGV